MDQKDRIYVLRESIVKITRMLTNDGIVVQQRGVSAYVRADKTGKPVLVNLPYIPDNATEGLILAIQGFLDHEVAHVLFTDFPLMGEAHKVGAGHMLNLLEDAFIEKKMAQKYAGSAYNLSNTAKFFLDKYTNIKYKEAIVKKDQNAAIAVLLVPLIRAMAGQAIWQEYMRDKMDVVEPVYEKIKDLEPAILAATSTKDNFELAKEIIKRIDGTKAPPRPAKKASTGASPGGTKPVSPAKPAVPAKGAAAPSKEDEEEPAPAAEDEDDEEEVSSPTPSPTPAKKEEPTESDEEEAPPEEDEDEGLSIPLPRPEDSEKDEIDELDDAPEPPPVEDEDGVVSPGSSMPSGPPDETGTPISGAMMEAIDKETATEFDEKMSRLISDSAAKEASSKSGTPYLIYATDKDKIEPLHIGRDYKDSMLTDMESQVDHMVAPLQKDLERAIAARSASVKSSGHRSGRLNGGSLARLAVGDDRVFYRREDNRSKDVACSIVVDMSGSMNGPPIMLACLAALALSQVLERIKIKHEVIGFTTGDMYDHEKMREEEAKMGRRYSRSESLFMPILKGYDERLTPEVKKRFAWAPRASFLRNNVDGECVEVARRRLMQRREKGKLMMVLSDGFPSATGGATALAEHLKAVVRRATQEKINIVGIGIMSEAVKEFYPKNIVLGSIKELPERCVKELRQLLMTSMA